MSNVAHTPRVVETFRLGHAVARILVREAEDVHRYTVAIAIGVDNDAPCLEFEEDELEDVTRALQAAQTILSYVAGRSNLMELARRVRGFPLEGV